MKWIVTAALSASLLVPGNLGAQSLSTGSSTGHSLNAINTVPRPVLPPLKYSTHSRTPEVGPGSSQIGSQRNFVDIYGRQVTGTGLGNGRYSYMDHQGSAVVCTQTTSGIVSCN